MEAKSHLNQKKFGSIYFKHLYEKYGRVLFWVRYESGFFKGWLLLPLFGHFHDHELHGMLEEAELETVNNVLPLISGFVSSFCGTGNNGGVSRGLTWYGEMVRDLFQQNKLFHWSEDSTAKLQTYIRRFETAAQKLFKEYQAQIRLHRSGMP